MTTSRNQLALNLVYLLKEDSHLLNDVILEYIELLNDNRMYDMLEYTTNEIRSDR